MLQAARKAHVACCDEIVMTGEAGVRLRTYSRRGIVNMQSLPKLSSRDDLGR
jgi:hypothetical protein